MCEGWGCDVESWLYWCENCYWTNGSTLKACPHYTLDAHSMRIQSALISSALFTPFYECASDESTPRCGFDLDRGGSTC